MTDHLNWLEIDTIISNDFCINYLKMTWKNEFKEYNRVLTLFEGGRTSEVDKYLELLNRRLISIKQDIFILHEVNKQL